MTKDNEDALPAVVQVPQGYRLVPVKPTPEMMDAAVKAICYGPQGGFTRISGPYTAWTAMLSAAPEAPAQAIPSKLPIPPAGADALDVVYAEGWNAACDAFFGGKPAPDPVVISVEKPSVPAPWREAVKVMREALDNLADVAGDLSPSCVADAKAKNRSLDYARAAIALADRLEGGE